MPPRNVQAGREQSSQRLLASNSFFRRGTKGWTRATSAELNAQKAGGLYATTYAQRLANQLNYSTAGKTFAGYADVGYGKGAEGFETVCNYKSSTFPIYHIFQTSTALVKVW